MENEEDTGGISPTILSVIEQFSADMRADETIDDQAVERIEKLLRTGSIPKQEEIGAALFGDDDTKDGEA